MIEATGVILEFGTLFSCNTERDSEKAGLDGTLFMDETVTSTIRETSFGEGYHMQQCIETTTSTVQDEYHNMFMGAGNRNGDLIPSRGVLREILNRCNGQAAVLSLHRSRYDCEPLLANCGLVDLPLVMGTGGLGEFGVSLTGSADVAYACAQLDADIMDCILVSDNPHLVSASKDTGVEIVGVLTQEETALQALGNSIPADAKTLELYRAGAHHVISSGLNELLDLLPPVDQSTDPTAEGKYSTFTQSPPPRPLRTGTVQYTSRKSGVSCAVTLDGSGIAHISTGSRSLDGLIALMAQYGRFDISLVCASKSVHWDSGVKQHNGGAGVDSSGGGGGDAGNEGNGHPTSATTVVTSATEPAGVLATAPEHISAQTVEDCATALGEAFDKALGIRAEICSAGSAYGVADEAQCRAVVDLLAARPYTVLDLNFNNGKKTVGGLPCDSIEQLLRSFVLACRINLHISCLYAAHSRHKVGAAFKALGAALHQAVQLG